MDEPEEFGTSFLMESFKGISNRVELLGEYRTWSIDSIQKLGSVLVVQQNNSGFDSNDILRVLHRDGLDLDLVSSAIDNFLDLMAEVTVYFHQLTDSANFSAQIEPIISEELKLAREMAKFKGDIAKQDFIQNFTLVLGDLKQKGKEIQTTIHQTKKLVLSWVRFI